MEGSFVMYRSVKIGLSDRRFQRLEAECRARGMRPEELVLDVIVMWLESRSARLSISDFSDVRRDGLTFPGTLEAGDVAAMSSRQKLASDKKSKVARKIRRATAFEVLP